MDQVVEQLAHSASPSPAAAGATTTTTSGSGGGAASGRSSVAAAAAGASTTSSGSGGGAAFSPAWVVPSSALEFIRNIGAGSFGSVFEVNYRGVRIAAKKMGFVVEADRQEVDKILRTEFRALQQLQHPHILRMHGVVVDEPMSLTLLVELAPVGSLRKLLSASASRVLASRLAQVSILSGTALGMSFLHDQKPKPVLHHDLKSDNVLLWEQGHEFVAKIGDFGLATGTQASTMRTGKGKSGAGAGTLAYKAPEAFDDEFTTASEVYSFGVVAWEVLTGAVPWDGYSEARLTKAIIKEERPPLAADAAATPLGQLVQRCWALEPVWVWVCG